MTCKLSYETVCSTWAVFPRSVVWRFEGSDWSTVTTHSKQLRYEWEASHVVQPCVVQNCYTVSCATTGRFCEESIECSLYETVNSLHRPQMWQNRKQNIDVMFACFVWGYDSIKLVISQYFCTLKSHFGIAYFEQYVRNKIRKFRNSWSLWTWHLLKICEPLISPSMKQIQHNQF